MKCYKIFEQYYIYFKNNQQFSIKFQNDILNVFMKNV